MKKLLFFILFPFCFFSQGTFRVESGTSIVGTNDPIITLYNTNLQNNTGTNNLGSGTIWGFIGNIPQTISGTYISNFYGLILNNQNGFSLQSNTTISNKLDMVSGDILTNSNTLEIGTSSSNIGVINWTDGTIIGPLKRWFAPSTNSSQSSGIFPIGNNSTNRYVIINYTQAPSSGGYITVEYKSGIPNQVDNYSGLPFNSSDGQIVQNYDDGGYFNITPDDYNGSLNSSSFTIKMRGININNVNDYTTLRLVKNPGPSHSGWVPCGTHTNVTGTNSDFTITSTNVVGFSWFNFGGNNNNPLPVELLYFDGKPYLTFNVLKWSTVSEHNSAYFDLESSIDGDLWKNVTTKQAAGFSTETLNYSYIDNNIDEKVYYRLLQYDIDGKLKIYGPIVINKSLSNKKLVKCVNLMGQEVPSSTNGVIIEIYDDGTIRRVFR